MQTTTFNGQPIKPGKVVCIGKNYTAHIAEMSSVPADDMVVFMKPATSIGQKLVSVMGEPLHYEGEICLMMLDGQVGGVGFGLDLTKRATQAQLKAAGLPWERSKAFMGSALFSDFVHAPQSLDQLGIELHVDGDLRQKGDVSLMLYPPSIILQELNQFLQLDDYDIVMTGTPAGVGRVQAGACFEGRILDGEQELVVAEWTAE